MERWKFNSNNILVNLSFFSWLTFLLNGPFEYIQYIIFNRVLLTPGTLFLIIFISSVSVFFLGKSVATKNTDGSFNRKSKIKNHKKIKISAIDFQTALPIASLFISYILGSIVGEYNSTLVDFFKVIYIYIATPFLGIVSKKAINFPFLIMLKTLSIIFIPIAILGIAQSLSNNTIIDVTLIAEESDYGFQPGNIRDLSGFFVYGGRYLGQTLRATSFFRSPFDFGLASLFFYLFYLNLLIQRRSFYNIVLVIIFLAAAYSSLLRNIHISIVLGTIFCVLITLLRLLLKNSFSPYMKGLSIYSPFIYSTLYLFPLLSLLLLLFGTVRTVLSGVNDYNESLFARYETWLAFLNKLMSKDFTFFLFGDGTLQPSLGGDNIVFDNTYVAIWSFAGFLFFASLMSLYFWMYRKSLFAVVNYQGSSQVVWVSFLCLFACFPSLAWLNNLSGGWPIFGLPTYWMLIANQDS
jgi:hypothetical protein